MTALFAQAGGFTSPTIDYHAFAPEIVLVGVLVVVLIADLVFERDKWLLSSLAGIGVLGFVNFLQGCRHRFAILYDTNASE